MEKALEAQTEHDLGWSSVRAGCRRPWVGGCTFDAYTGEAVRRCRNFCMQFRLKICRDEI